MTTSTQHTEHEIARLRREHAALLEFVQMLAKADGGILHGYGVVDDARALLQEIAAIDSTPATPASTEAATGERYPMSTVTSIHGSTMYVVNGYNFKSEAQAQEYAKNLNNPTPSARYVVENFYDDSWEVLDGHNNYTFVSVHRSEQEARTEAARLNALPQAGHAAAGDGEAGSGEAS